MEKTQLPKEEKGNKKKVLIAGILALLLLTVLIALSVLNPNTPQTQSNLPNPSGSSHDNQHISVRYEVNIADIPAPAAEDFTAAIFSPRADAGYKFLTAGQQQELESSSIVKRNSNPIPQQSYTITWKDTATAEKTPRASRFCSCLSHRQTH